jgi:hypothetical protein
VAVREVSDLADGAQLIDDPGHVQPAQRLGRGRQSTRTPVHHGSQLRKQRAELLLSGIFQEYHHAA